MKVVIKPQVKKLIIKGFTLDLDAWEKVETLPVPKSLYWAFYRVAYEPVNSWQEFKPYLGCSFSHICRILNWIKLNGLIGTIENPRIPKYAFTKETLYAAYKHNGKFDGYVDLEMFEFYAYLSHKRFELFNYSDMKTRILPIDFSEANLTLAGKSDNVDDLRVFNDGDVSVSCWRPSFLTVVKLLFTRKIWMGVKNGRTQPPVWLSADYPFIK